MNDTNEMNSSMFSFLTLAKFMGVQAKQSDIVRINNNSNIKEPEVLLLQYARHYKLKSKLCVLNVNSLVKKMEKILPLIAKSKEGKYFIIAKIQDGKAIALFHDKGIPEVLELSELTEIWDGTSILITRRLKESTETFFSFKWFIPTILKFKTEFILVLIATLVIQILGILTPVMTQVVVDKVLSHRTLSTLNVLAVAILVVYVFDLVLALAKNYLFAHTTNRIDVMLSAKLFKHLFALPLRYFESRRAGETVARVRELDSIRHFLTGTPLSSMIDFVFIIVYVVVLLFYSKSLTGIVVISIPVYAVLSLIVTPMFKKRLDEKFNAGAQTSSFLVEAINGVQTVKSFAVEDKFECKWGDLQADYVKAGYRTTMVSSTAGTIGQFIQKVFDLIILYCGAKAVMSGDFTVGQLVAFRMLSGRISGPVLRLVQLWQEYQQAAMSVKRIGDIFNSPVEIVSTSGISSIPELKGNINFDKVRFRYNINASEAIKDMSFSIEAGKIVGIVGRSGSGKSTISKLIQRLYIPENGKITIDGIDIAMINPWQLRKQIGVVLQENFMFNGSVRENISIHMPGASFEQIVKAAITAGAHDFISSLPNGYDTIIGEKGVGLSGGQKQRVAIARAILANPKILIFDEATSALDYESESIIQSNLKDICKGRTVLIIAHRLSTLKSADKIMVVDNGNLLEYDTHTKLMENRGLYHSLYSMQLREDTDESC